MGLKTTCKCDFPGCPNATDEVFKDWILIRDDGWKILVLMLLPILGMVIVFLASPGVWFCPEHDAIMKKLGAPE